MRKLRRAPPNPARACECQSKFNVKFNEKNLLSRETGDSPPLSCGLPLVSAGQSKKQEKDAGAHFLVLLGVAVVGHVERPLLGVADDIGGVREGDGLAVRADQFEALLPRARLWSASLRRRRASTESIVFA